MPHQYLNYWDQALYYNHCRQLYRDASDYLIVVDLDEVLALDPSHYNDPAASLNRWLDTWEEDIGSYIILRMDLAMPADIYYQGLPSIDSLAQDLWTTVNTDTYVLERSQFAVHAE